MIYFQTIFIKVMIQKLSKYFFNTLLFNLLKYNNKRKRKKLQFFDNNYYDFQFIIYIGEKMKRELSSKQIFNDFVNKTILTDNEKEILTRYVKGETIIKMATETSQSASTVSTTIANLKKKYEDYKKLELAKLLIFK